MLDDILTVFLGRAPTPADRAIYKDQENRLAQLYDTTLLGVSDRLQILAPFEAREK